MLVRNWMSKDVFTVTPDISLLKIAKLMRDKHIRRLPIVSQGKVVGIISDRDVRDSSPSKATTLDIYEIHYLLAEIKAADIMTKNPITVKSTDTIEKAAMIMLDHKISGLPVVDDGKLVGIISEQDVFKALVNITGVREGGFQIGFSIPNKQGAMKPVFDAVRNHGARILSVLTANNDEGERTIFLRMRSMENRAKEDELIEVLKEYCNLLYIARNDVELA